jgi:3-hydroxyacyl-[acyl-carrier-protein] dehydratase
MFLNKDQVMEFLPHRDPFLFIDSVRDIILPENLKLLQGPFEAHQLIGGKTICTFQLNESLNVLAGHFPGNPILPGVVQVEMMAQAASFLARYCKKREDSKIEVALLGIDSARFRKPITPPMELEIFSTLTKVRGPVQIYECEIFSNGELMSQSTVMASLRFND